MKKLQSVLFMTTLLIVASFASGQSTAPAASQPSTKPSVIKYNGTVRSQTWLDAMYKRYSPSTRMWDGACYDVGVLTIIQFAYTKTKYPMPQLIQSEPPREGSITLASPKILQVLEGNEVIATVTDAISKDTVSLHIKTPAGGLVDGQYMLDSYLIYLGTYSYASVGGTTRTIQSYGHLQPITKDEFALAISLGFKLYDHKAVFVKPDPNNKDWSKGLLGRAGAKFKVVNVPQP